MDEKEIRNKLYEVQEQRNKGLEGIKKAEEMVIELRKKITEMYATLYHIEGMVEAYESLLPKKEDSSNG